MAVYLLFIREDISSNLVEAVAKPIEGFHIELTLRNDKWLVNCSYNPHKNNIGNHLKALSDSWIHNPQHTKKYGF